MCLEELKSRKDLSLDEIEILLDNETDVKTFKKLLYFKFKLLGFSKIDSCNYAGIKESSRYYLDDLWDNGGYNALIPHYGGGRKSKLSEKQIKDLKEILDTKDGWLVDDAKKLIEDKFKVEYGYHGVRNLLIKLDVPIINHFDVQNEKNKNFEYLLENFNNLSIEENEEIKIIINKMSAEKSVFVYKKLCYLLFRKIGFDNNITSSFLGISMATGNNWLNQWVSGGYNSLLRKPGQGRRRKLSDEQIEELKKTN